MDGSPAFPPFARPGWHDRDGPDSPDIRDLGDRMQGSMRPHVPQLTRSVVDSLLKSEPAYHGGTIPSGELAPWIEKSINRALDACPMPAAMVQETLDVARRTGRRRAGQGVPPRALLRGYHIGGQVMCAAVLRWTSAEGLTAEQSAMLVGHVWRVVDAHSAAAVAALCAALERFTDHPSAGFLLDALLNGDVGETTAATVARAFGLPEQGRYAVIVVQPGPAGAPVQPEDLVPYTRGIRLIWRMHGQHALGVAVLADKTPAPLRDLIDLREYRTGVSAVVTGLVWLGRARQQAEWAARTLAAAGLAFFEERLPAVMVTMNPGIARELRCQVLAPVLSLEAVRREALLTTLEAWLAADGSVAKAASSMYCHRNTVLNRLKRIEQLTGRSLSVPRHVVDIVLALEAFRQFSDRESTGLPAEQDPAPT